MKQLQFLTNLRVLKNMIEPPGYFIIFGTFICFPAYFALGWPFLGIISSFSVILLMISVPFIFSSQKLEIDFTTSKRRVPVDGEVQGFLKVKNIGISKSLFTTVEIKMNSNIYSVTIPPLKKSNVFEKPFKIPTVKREILTIGPIENVNRDPFGLFRIVRPSTGVTDSLFQLYVHPKLILVSPKIFGTVHDLEGDIGAEICSDDLIFNTITEYTHNDSFKNINWKASAREGKLMSNQYQRTLQSQLSVIVSIDKFDYGLDETGEQEFEKIISVVASLSVSALLNNQILKIYTTDGKKIPSKTVQNVLDELTVLEMSHFESEKTTKNHANIVGNFFACGSMKSFCDFPKKTTVIRCDQKTMPKIEKGIEGSIDYSVITISEPQDIKLMLRKCV